MPKQVLTINDFSGGLVTDVSPRDLEPNQLQLCTNVDPSRRGRLTASRIFNDNDSDFEDFNSGVHTVPGYGLFIFSNDVDVSGGAANVDDFLIKADGNTIDVQELEDRQLTTDVMGATSGSPVFYTAEGDLFTGGDHTTTPTALVYHYQRKMRGADGISTAGDVAYWEKGKKQTRTRPVNNTDMKISEFTAASGSTALTAKGADNINWVLGYGADTSGGWNNDATSSTDGDYVEFGFSFLYKNNAESAIVSGDSGTSWQGADTNEHINSTLTIHAYMSVGPTTATDDDVYGARLYSKMSGENTWYLLAELNYEKGIKGDLETEFTPWQNATDTYGHAAFGATVGFECTTNPIADPPRTLTFRTLNGYDYDDVPEYGTVASEGRVYFKHGTIANSRAYIGNVKIDNRTYGDRILKSPIFQYDVFTESAFIDVAINDGDSITALEAYADRLLEFKRKALYILNISKELEFLEDVRIGAGVDHEAAVTKTPFGVVWANQTGCFLYDGEQITQLSMGKISNTDWANVTANVIVGYDLPSRQIVVLWNGATGGGQNAYVYTLDTQSWHLVNDMVGHASNVTNMVNTSDGKLLIGAGDVGADEVSVYGSRIVDINKFDMKTGQLSMGTPGNKKNLLNVKVRFKNSGSALKVNILVDDAAASIGEDEIPLGTLTNDTSGELVTKEFDTSATTTLHGQYWFIVQIQDEDSTGTTHRSFELDEIVLTYRDLGVR